MLNEKNSPRRAQRARREDQQGALELKLPLFIGVAGKDRIVDSRAARAVYDSAGTPSETRTWRQWDDACHTLCWDPLTPEIIGEVASWAIARVEKAPAK
jgi:alpha-beta hydrolase superfamily lysophospholipase